MKKITAIVLALTMVFALAACGSEKAPAEEMPELQPADILNSVWESWGEDKQFAAMGGDMDNMVDNGAGEFGLQNAELVFSMLHLSEDTAAMADSAASLIHAMNANTFTGAAFHIAEGADAEAFAAAAQEEILATQWMCGFPEQLVIYSVGGCVVYALGNGEIVTNFKDAMTQLYAESAVLVCDTAIA